jgi:tRNA nucleotidyltransferase/poly(A) polymerase
VDICRLPSAVLLLNRELPGTEFKDHVYITGGCVRDLLLGEDSKDIDLIVLPPAEPLNLARYIQNKRKVSRIQIFKRNGVVAFKVNEVFFEVSKSKPHELVHREESATERGQSLKKDAYRRDFTVNALYIKIGDSEIIDPTGMGMQDIMKLTIRSIIEPELCFATDPLRMIRAIRLAISLNAQIETNTYNAILTESSSIRLVASERVKEELTRILTSDKWIDGFMLIKNTGLLHHISPVMDGCLTDNGLSTLAESIKNTSYHTRMIPDPMKIRITFLIAYLYEVTIRQTKQSIIQNQTLQVIFHDILRCFNVKKKVMAQVTNIIASYLYLKDRLGTDFQFEAYELVNAAICLKDDTLILEALLKSVNGATQDVCTQRIFASQIEQLHKYVSKLSNHKLPITGNDLMSLFPGIPKKAVGCLKEIALMLWLSNEKISKTDLIDRLHGVSAKCCLECSSCTRNESDESMSNVWEQLDARIQRMTSIITDPCFYNEHRI